MEMAFVVNKNSEMKTHREDHLVQTPYVNKKSNHQNCLTDEKAARLLFVKRK